MRHPLNFDWKFAPDYKEEYLENFSPKESVDIPHCVKQVPYNYFDENGSIMQYANRVVSIEYSGPITVLGDDHQALLGGQLSLYVLSKRDSGKAKIRISIDSIVKEIELSIKQ